FRNRCHQAPVLSNLRGIIGGAKARARTAFFHARRRAQPLRDDELDLHLAQSAGRCRCGPTRPRNERSLSARGDGERRGAKIRIKITIGFDIKLLILEITRKKGVTEMATTMQPATGETTKQLVNYRTDGGVAVIEMCDPPANTYTYEMNRQLDEAILKARMDNDVYVIVMTGAGDKFFSAGANIKMLCSVDPTF